MEEARKLEELLEQERYAKIKQYNNAREAEQQRKNIYAMEIKQQIKENEYKKKYSEDVRKAEVRIKVLYIMRLLQLHIFIHLGCKTSNSSFARGTTRRSEIPQGKIGKKRTDKKSPFSN